MSVVFVVVLALALLGVTVAEGPRVLPVRMKIGKDGRLTISRMPAFPYDGSGRDSEGTMTDNRDGTAALFFPASQSGANPLPMIPGAPWILLRVEIEPHDLVGTV